MNSANVKTDGIDRELTHLGNLTSMSHVPCGSNQARDILSVAPIKSKEYKMHVRKWEVPRIGADDWVPSSIHQPAARKGLK
jgi:hypothetical protein